MKIEEVQSTTKRQRVATHTHIKVSLRARRRTDGRSIGDDPAGTPPQFFLLPFAPSDG
jgi:hypothetical protein